MTDTVIDIDSVVPKEITRKIPKADLDLLKINIATDAQATENQRDQADEDMRFFTVIGGQWENFFESETQDRLKLQFPLFISFINRVQAEWNMNRMGVEFKAGDDLKTSDKDAELINSIQRRDFRLLGSGKKAIDNAVRETMFCGYGAYKIAERFEDLEDAENELQRIQYLSIQNAYNTVFWDNASQTIDKSDARRCTVLKRFTKESFLEQFPGEKPSSAYDPNNRSDNTHLSHPPDGIYIATVYEVINKEEKVFVYFNTEKGEMESFVESKHEEIESVLKKQTWMEFQRMRKIPRKKITMTILSGDKVLQEPKVITGKFIPIIPMYGFWGYVSGSEYYKGLIRDNKDFQRLFNQLISKLAETAASSAPDIPIVTSEQAAAKGFKELWSAPSDKAFLIIDPIIDDGKIVGTGPIGYKKAQAIDPSTGALLEGIPALIDKVTGGAPQETQDPTASGKAILAARKIQDLGTQPMLENISASISWGGEVYLSKAIEIYTESRIIRTVGKDGMEKAVELNKDVFDPEIGEFVTQNTIMGKKFNVYSDTGVQYETMREQQMEESKQSIELLSKIPGMEEIVHIKGLMMVLNSSGPGTEPDKKKARIELVLMELLEPDDDEEIQMLQEHKQRQGQPNAQEETIKAFGEEAQANARKSDSQTQVNIASAGQKVSDTKKTDAETLKILSDIPNDQAKTASQIKKDQAEINKDIIERVSALPI